MSFYPRLRIVGWPFKVLYVLLVVIGTRLTLGWAIRALEWTNAWWALVAVAMSLGLIVAATRIFRGPGEDVAPARPLWRLTATSGWSIGMAVVMGLSTLDALTGVPVVLAQAGSDDMADIPSLILELLGSGLLTALFVRSAVGLRRLEAAAIPPAPLFPWHGRPLDLAGPTTRALVEESTATAAGADGRRGLLTPSTSQKHLEVLVDGRRIGALPSGSIAIRDLVLRAGGPVSVGLVRTGDLLWAEVPTDALVEAALAVEPTPAS